MPSPFAEPSDPYAHLSPREVVHTARNVVETAIGPIHVQMNDLKDMLRRLVGDDPSAQIPESLRHKGLVKELQEQHNEQFEIQKKWKAEQDEKDLVAIQAREAMRAAQAKTQVQLAALEKRVNED